MQQYIFLDIRSSSTSPLVSFLTKRRSKSGGGGGLGPVVDPEGPPPGGGVTKSARSATRGGGGAEGDIPHLLHVGGPQYVSICIF